VDIETCRFLIKLSDQADGLMVVTLPPKAPAKFGIDQPKLI
jgi:hypothetical protein